LLPQKFLEAVEHEIKAELVFVAVVVAGLEDVVVALDVVIAWARSSASSC
jgi:hypothetical protein